VTLNVDARGGLGVSPARDCEIDDARPVPARTCCEIQFKRMLKHRMRELEKHNTNETSLEKQCIHQKDYQSQKPTKSKASEADPGGDGSNTEHCPSAANARPNLGLLVRTIWSPSVPGFGTVTLDLPVAESFSIKTKTSPRISPVGLLTEKPQLLPYSAVSCPVSVWYALTRQMRSAVFVHNFRLYSGTYNAPFRFCIHLLACN
jgi:hypothetical protein